MSNQIVISSGAKVRELEGVLTGTSGVVNSLAINVPNGIPQLDGSGKILVSQLPNSVMEYKGSWNAATNTPTLVNGTGNAGDVYLCEVAGTVNFGAGPIAFFVGDQVVYSGTIWQRASGSTGTVTSVSVTESGDALTITGSPITTSGTINIGFTGTSGQYVNGAGGLTTFPTDNITGSGASGQVTYFNGTNTITGENAFNYDASTNRLGVNTTVPNATIGANAGIDSGYSLLLKNDNANYNGIGFATDSTYGNLIATEKLGTATTRNLTLLNQSGYISLTEAGNLGVGILNPNTGIDIYNGTTSSLWLHTANSGITGTDGVRLALFSNNGANLRNFEGSFSITAEGDFSVITLGAENFKINSADGSIYQSKVANAMLKTVSGVLTAAVAGTDYLAPSAISGTTNTVAKFASSSTIGNSNITDTGSLITLGSTTNISSGNFGVGTSSPAVAGVGIDIYSATSAGLRFHTATSGTTVSDGAGINFSAANNLGITNYEAGAIDIVTNGNSGVYINQLGYVGINGATPSSELTVNGNAAISGLTTGQIVFPTTGGLLIGSSSLFWDNTNGRLAVGTNNTSTGRKLTIYSASADTHLAILGAAPSVRFADNFTATYSTLFGMATASNNYVTGAVAGDFVITYNSSNNLIFGNSNTSLEKMRINSSGNLLINTTNDNGANLNVNGVIYGTRARLNNSYDNSSVSLNVGGQTYMDSRTSRLYQTYNLSSMSNYMHIYDPYSSVNANGGFSIGASSSITTLPSTSIIHFDGVNNRVGIGTTAPSAALSVVGAATFTGALSGTSAAFSGAITIGNYDGQALKLQSATSTGNTYLRFYNSAGATRGYFGLFNSGGTDYTLLDGSSTDVTINGNSNLYLQTGGTNRLTIASTGTATFSNSIQIGTNAATVTAGLAIGIANDNAIRWRNSSNTGNLGMYLSGGNQFVFDSSIYANGEMTSTSNATFGSSTSTSNVRIYSNSSPFTIFGSTGYARGFIGLTWDVNPDKGIIVGNELRFNTNAVPGTTIGSTVLTLTSAGAATFSSSVTATGVSYISGNSNTGPIPYLQFTDNYGSAGRNWALINGYDNYGTLSFKVSTTIGGNPYSGTSVLSMTQAGNVGIGTSSPSANLMVNAGSGALTQDILIVKGGGSLGAYGFSVQANNGQAIFRTDNYTYNVLMCENGGNVGIGTSSPLQTATNRTVLTVNGTSSVLMNLAVGGTLAAYWYSGGSSSQLYSVGQLDFNTSNASGFTFNPNGAEAMRITSGGDICIASTAPVSTRRELRIGGNAAGSRISLGLSGTNYSALVTDSGGNFYMANEYNDANIKLLMINYNNGVYLSQSATSWTANSDERLKEINGIIENALEKIMTLRAVNFSWKSDESKKEVFGFIAQDVEKVFPQVIDKNKLVNQKTEVKDETEYLGVRYQELTPVNTKAIQELYLLVQQQQQQISELKALIAAK